MIINKSIDKNTFKDLMEMYKRQGIKVTDKILDDKFVSYVAEGIQHIFIDKIIDYPARLIGDLGVLVESKSTPDDTQKFNFSNKEKNVMPDVKIGDSRIAYGYSDGKLKIYSIRTPANKRGNGSARLAMQEFLKQADKEGLDVYLDSSPLDNKTNGTKLVQFYKSLGFELTGKSINSAGDPEMVRKANKSIIESIQLIAKDYIKHHGKNPSGVGSWIFGIGSRKSEDWFEFKGKFVDGKKKAILKAEEKEASKIYIMENLSGEFHDVKYVLSEDSEGYKYRVALVVDGNEIAVTKSITESGALNIGKNFVHNVLIERALSKPEYKSKEKIVKGMKSKISDFKKRYGDQAKSVMYATATKLAKESVEESELLIEKDYQATGIWYHGSPSGKFVGSHYGLHVGTKLAATQALQARIGVPTTGEWDGTREYGKTLLAGRKNLEVMEKERGYYLTTGYNAGSEVPEEDYYASDRKELPKFSDGSDIKLNDKPKIFKLKINVPMSNTPQNPMQDFKANGYMAANIKKGTARRGYFYINDGEDEGSISAVLPPIENNVTLVNESVENDPNIGRKWKDRYGDEIEVEFVKDGKYYTLKNGRSSGGEIIPIDQLERTIKVDTSWYNHKLKTDKDIADQEAAELASKQAKDKEYSNIKGSSKLDTGRKIKALDKKLRLSSGEILTVKQIIDREIENGAKLEVHNFWNDKLGKSVPETVLMSTDGTYRDNKSIGKIGLEYAKEVLNQTNEIVNETEESILEKDESIQRIPYKVLKSENGYYKIIDNLGQLLNGDYEKEDADALIKHLNASGVINVLINESAKLFEIKYKSTDGSNTQEGSKRISAPDKNLATERFKEDNSDLKNLQIISVTEVQGE